MKVQMIKAVHAGGSFRKVGEVVDVNDEQADELIRTGLATAEVTEKKSSKAKK
tara:strand:- start:642 stop:800 length:159 start_codon:yes stop_codon:yes gene_type:complete